MDWGQFKKYIESKGVSDKTKCDSFDILACVKVEDLKVVVRKTAVGDVFSVSN